MTLYTRTGDDGTTGLFGGQRVGKDALRVEAYGSVDEVNSLLGWCAAACEEPTREIADVLRELQHRLFELGADLSTPRPTQGADQASIPRIGPEQVVAVEKLIDAVVAPLPEMKTFILPGGSELASRLHVARTACRRAERICVALARAENIGPDVCVFLNRLSDLLFALARRSNQLLGVDDVPWLGRGKR